MDGDDSFSDLSEVLNDAETEARLLVRNAPKRRYSRNEKERFIRKIIDLSVSRIQFTGSTTEVSVRGKREQFPGLALGPFHIGVTFAGQRIGSSIETDNSIEIWLASEGKVMNVHWLEGKIDISAYRLIGQWEADLIDLLRVGS